VPLNYGMFRVLQAAVLTGVWLLTFTALAQEADRHTISDPAQVLYMRSSWAHGYIHGYEQGFHTGDLEVQMGHEARPLDQFKVYREISGYLGEDDHGAFRRGYREGFRVAYHDALSGGVFCAIAQIRRAAEGLEKQARLAKREFDQALAEGYESGWVRGVQRERLVSGVQRAVCLAHQWSPSYCDAFSRGFELGYDAGARGPDAHAMQTAQVRRK